jgi:hypothetical protein
VLAQQPVGGLVRRGADHHFETLARQRLVLERVEQRTQALGPLVRRDGDGHGGGCHGR